MSLHAFRGRCHTCGHDHDRADESLRDVLDIVKQTRATGTEARVCEDIAARQAVGIRKYGTTVHDNPLPLRQWLQHAYEETIDQAVYLRRAIEQIDRELGAG